MSSVLDEGFEELETLPEFVSVMAARDPAALLALDVGTSGVRAALFTERDEKSRVRRPIAIASSRC